VAESRDDEQRPAAAHQALLALPAGEQRWATEVAWWIFRSHGGSSADRVTAGGEACEKSPNQSRCIAAAFSGLVAPGDPEDVE
jgi:hypothetical protein